MESDVVLITQDEIDNEQVAPTEQRTAGDVMDSTKKGRRRHPDMPLYMPVRKSAVMQPGAAASHHSVETISGGAYSGSCTSSSARAPTLCDGAGLPSATATGLSNDSCGSTTESDCGGARQKSKPRSASKREQVMEDRGSGCSDQQPQHEQRGRQGRPTAAAAAADCERTASDRRPERQSERGNGDCTTPGDTNYRLTSGTQKSATGARRNDVPSSTNQNRSRGGDNSRGDSRELRLSSSNSLSDRHGSATVDTELPAESVDALNEQPEQQVLSTGFAAACRLDGDDTVSGFDKVPTLVFSRTSASNKGTSSARSAGGVTAASAAAGGIDTSGSRRARRSERAVETAKEHSVVDRPACDTPDNVSNDERKGSRKPQLSRERHRKGPDAGTDADDNASSKEVERHANTAVRKHQQQREPPTRPPQNQKQCQQQQQQQQQMPAAAGRLPEGISHATKEPMTAVSGASVTHSTAPRAAQQQVRMSERPKEASKAAQQNDGSGRVHGGSGKRKTSAARRQDANASGASSSAASHRDSHSDAVPPFAMSSAATVAAAAAAASSELTSSSADRQQAESSGVQQRRGGLIKLPTAAVSPQPQLSDAALATGGGGSSSRLTSRSKGRPALGVSSSGGYPPAGDPGWPYGSGPPLPPMWPSRDAAVSVFGGSSAYAGYADHAADSSYFGTPYYNYYSQLYPDAYPVPASQLWSSSTVGSGGGNAAQIQLLMHELMPAYQQLTELAGRRLHGGAILDHLNQLRPCVRDTCEKIILMDAEFAYTNGVDQMLWRAAYHLVIESLRKQTARSVSGSNDDDEEGDEIYDQGSGSGRVRHTAAGAQQHSSATVRCAQLLEAILDEGSRFYGHLITAIERAYGVSAESPGETPGDSCPSSSADDAAGSSSGFCSSTPVTAVANANSSRVHGRRMQKFALLSCQRVFVCLGDIARYKEFVSHTSNFGKSRSWYLKALRIAPKNGSPYHQLALLALYTGRKLEAVYYYMRCLAASNPFLSARENLAVLFDEIRKKMDLRIQKEAMEKREQERKRAARRQQLEDRLQPPDRSGSSSASAPAAASRRSPSQQQLGLSSGLQEPWSHRIEVWISPDGGRSSVRDSDDDESEINFLSQMSVPELLKEFSLSFLNTHGKLYTKIGMESFPEASSRLLHLLVALLHHPSVDGSVSERLSQSKPEGSATATAKGEERGTSGTAAATVASAAASAFNSVIGRIQFIELITINMFAIHHTALRGDGMDVESCRSFLQEQAIQLAMDMFAILVEHCTSLIIAETSPATATDRPGAEHLFIHPDLPQLLWVVKTWSDWMTCHPHLWNPPPCPRDPALGPVLDVWESLARFFNVLLKTDVGFVQVSVERHEGWDELRLPGHEHLLLGFLPLGDLPPQVAYAHPSVNKVVAEEAWLVMKLRMFADYVCGLEPPMLDYSVAQRQYVSLMLPPSASEKKSGGTTCLDHGESEEFSLAKDSTDLQHSVSGGASVDDDHVKELLAKQRELRQAIVEEQARQETRKAVFDKECRSIRVEITPAFLIPDTNCFIDNLHLVRRLVESRKYSIVVPLVVINELDGLSRSRVARRQKPLRSDDLDDDSGRASVGSSAAAAISYLEEAFESGSFKNLTALTARGNSLNTIQYRSEERDQVGNNDDKILACCVHYCKDRASSFMPKERSAPITLVREVVLLTDDRNLRLKAHTYNVPVKDIATFVKWCKIG